METNLSYAAWMVIGALCLAPAGAVFGAVAGALARSQGHAPGSAWAFSVADLLARRREQDFSPVGRAAVVGAVDGFLFLTLLGSILGLVAGYSGVLPAAELLLVVTTALALLAVTAVLLGLVAHALIHGQSRRLIIFFASSVGLVLGLCLAGTGGAGYGLLAGGAIGLIGSATRRHQPHEATFSREDSETSD